MKKLLVGFLTTLSILSACQSSEENKNSERVEKKNKPAKVDPAIISEKVLEVPWVVLYNDTTDVLELKKNPAADLSNLRAKDIIEALNIKYPQIKLKWINQKGNKAFVKIADATYLTQQIGTAGAEAFFAEATFSLTEIQGINAVYFDFKEGDHAGPQTYTRESFNGFH